MGRQLLRSGTSVGAQYSEATRAQSNADWISKIVGPSQELEEKEYFPFITEQNSKGQANALP
jgi:four helix bundle protein